MAGFPANPKKQDWGKQDLHWSSDKNYGQREWKLVDSQTLKILRIVELG